MRKKLLDTKKMVTVSVLVAIAMILSYVEFLLPISTAIPGMKIGLSNIATVFALYTLGGEEAVSVSLVRVFLSALLFGNYVSLMYSLFGAALALLFMLTFYKLKFFSSVGVSVIGGVAHNAGQLIAASIILETGVVAVYMAPLAVVGTVAGILVGICAGILVSRVGKFL
jgi:heptaprenyl diphosphate synthase